MSGRQKICQIVPPTSQEMSRGTAIITRQPATLQPRRGIESATTIPNGTSIVRITAEKNRLRHNDAKNRPPRSVEGSSNSLNQPTPFQKNWLLPKVSCIE